MSHNTNKGQEWYQPKKSFLIKSNANINDQVDIGVAYS